MNFFDIAADQQTDAQSVINGVRREPRAVSTKYRFTSKPTVGLGITDGPFRIGLRPSKKEHTEFTSG
ncbi:hypothetical protein BVI2075_310004 [Burkholderia vietnamiensis]|nr:hypothetical protein BVI2075_310004 [Burkholderia vietnamiensis]CAG9227623.1 hypothetical protein BVI1335_680023 [Burkholderia vietnamiensis]